MSRVELRSPNQAQLVVEGLYKDLERRIESSPPGLCPVDMSRAFLEICHAQSCGKCVPCRVGLGQLKNLITDVLDGKATIRTLTEIHETAKSIMESADCAIGYEAANMVYKGAIGFKDDYVEHIMYHRCLSTLKQPVPCVSRCPARVDIPGYIALVREGRYEDAIRLIRKDNPFPTTCGFICEHPCEALCRRNMIDDAVNIRGLKRMAADAAGYVAPPECAESTGKNIAVVGGGPGGLSAAYFLQLMGHQVTVYEMLPKLGGMLRYGIPNYRLPKERLDDDIQAILNMRDAWKYLLHTVEELITFAYWCKLNEYIARNEALEWGKLRTGTVGISGTDYIPPIPEKETVIKELNHILSNSDMSATDKALEVFVWGTRGQFFWDGNKRTSLMLANKILVSAGAGIMTITDKYMEQFNAVLLKYYNTGKPDELKQFIYENAIHGINL